MSGRPISIVLQSKRLQINAPSDSPFVQGIHRIYATNILGLEAAEDFLGYTSTLQDDPAEVLLELVQYLQDNALRFEINKEAEEVIGRYRNQVTLLERSRNAGARLKIKPTKNIEIPGFKRRLKGYQIPAVAHLLAVENEANFSVPGSGKTTIVLAGYAVLKNENKIDTLIVVGPRSSFMPWEEEFLACFSREPRTLRIVGSKNNRKRLYAEVDDKEMVLLTYQMVANDVEEMASILRRRKVLLVVDESHHIKRFSGGQWSRILHSLAPLATKRVILSGTPTPNSLKDLWSQIAFLWPSSNPLGTPEEFRYRVEKKGTDLALEIRQELSPFYWRIHKSDLNLPSPKYHYYNLKMEPYQNAIYDALAARVLSDSINLPEDKMKLRQWRKARMVRLLQAASNPSLLTEYSTEFRIPPLDPAGLSIAKIIETYSQYEVPVKIKYVLKLLKRLIERGDKVIIWSVFVQNIKTLSSLLSKFSPGVIYGDVPRDDSEDEQFNREKIINEFKYSSSPLLIANPSACAESISLHRVCKHAIFFDRSFNAAHYMQSLDRIHRVGLQQNEQVNYYILRSMRTIDEVIDQRLKEKQRKMLVLLNDDFSILELDSPSEEFTEEAEEDKDFTALIDYLRRS